MHLFLQRELKLLRQIANRVLHPLFGLKLSAFHEPASIRQFARL